MIRRIVCILLSFVLFASLYLTVWPTVAKAADWPTDEKYPGTLLWPLDTKYRSISSEVGMRWGKQHNGTDICGMPKLTPVVAAEDGTAYRKWYGGYKSGSGNYVLIDHKNGYYTRYAHLAAYANCLKGSENAQAEVKKGQIIGYVGITGKTDGTHLHFEILKHAKGCANSYSSSWTSLKGALISNNKPFQSFSYQSVSDGNDISDLEIRNVYYPKTYVIGKGFNLQGGMVCSKNGLKSLSVKIVNSAGEAVSYMENPDYSNQTMPFSKEVNKFDVQDLDGHEDRGNKFSKIKAPGDYQWIFVAKDKAGQTVTLIIPFKAVSSGNPSYSHMSSFNQPGSSSYCQTKPDSIALNKQNYSLNLSNTLTLTATAYPSSASNAVTWSSSDTSVATVSSSGVVTPLKAGYTVIITATSTLDATKKATCQVTTYYQGTDTLKFSGVKYPHTYNKNKTISWAGKVESDVALSSVVINLYVGTSKYTQSGNISSGSKSFSMSSFGDTVFKKLSSGSFTFELIAIDSVGRRIAFSNDGCKVSTSGDHVMYDAPGSYSRPTLLGFGERNGHRYEVYENTGRNWDSDKEHAIELGGHLATISDTAENEFICDLVVSSGGTYGFVGGYYDSGWHWVDGSPFTYNPWNSNVPADGSFGYSAVVGLASANSKTWAKSLKSGMMNYVVEYDPLPVSAIVLEGEKIMTYGDSAQTLTATVLPENAYNKNIRYSSSNTSYATVNETTGLVTVVADTDSVVTIYATAQDGSGVVGEFTLYIRHKFIPVTNLSIHINDSLYTDDKKITLIAGQTASLETIITPNNADDKSVYFWSSNDNVASIDPYSNEVIAHGCGTCRIYCSTPDNLFTDYLDLIVLPVSGTWGNLTWSLNENGILTISGSGDMDDFGYNNNSDAWRPYAAAIKEVFIESGITSIGDYAFGNSNLRSITIPQGIQSIGYTAFYGCGSLTSITIPQSVTNIGAWAFGQCKALREIEIPNKITEISEYTFFGCDNISHITLPPSVTSISNNAFGYCFALTGFEIPSKVKTIGDSAFEYCNKLSVVKIPASVIDIGNNAFIGSANITLYGYGNSTAHEYANNNGISFYLLDYLFTTPDFTVPENLRTIEPEAFSGINAKSIKLCDNVVTIGSKAFSNCEKLLQILIPSSCTSIANDAFENIEELIIYGNFGSYAETYAHDHGITFEVPGSISEQIRQYVLDYLPDYYSYNLDLNKDGIVDTKDYSLAKMSGL